MLCESCCIEFGWGKISKNWIYEKRTVKINVVVGTWQTFAFCSFVKSIDDESQNNQEIVHIGAQSHPYEAPVRDKWDNKMISGIAFGPFVNITEIYGYSTSWSRILVWYHSTRGNGCWMKTSWLVCRKRSHPPRLSHLLRNCLTALSELPTSLFVAS